VTLNFLNYFSGLICYQLFIMYIFLEFSQIVYKNPNFRMTTYLIFVDLNAYLHNIHFTKLEEVPQVSTVTSRNYNFLINKIIFLIKSNSSLCKFSNKIECIVKIMCKKKSNTTLFHVYEKQIIYTFFILSLKCVYTLYV